MKLKTAGCAALSALLSLPAAAGQTNLDVRFGYNTTSENKDSRVKFMHTFNNGFYFSAEAAQNHGDSYFSGNDAADDEKNGLIGSAQEFEGRYQFNVSEDWYVAPALVVVTTKDRTDYRPYVKTGTTFANGIDFSARYRFNYSNDANGKTYLDGSGTTRDSSHQFDIWVAKSIADWGLMYNPRYRFQDGVDQGTGRDDYWEHTIVVSKKMKDGWTPYMELVSVDQTYVDDSGEHKNDYAVRLGINISL
ncbi:oligogalacturonate-specific porin KdgM family protein [Psychromonas aquimarina]|uniref:oligogalacturonate-specific porin KdgM family protein n=1 Tax=Psychromonas aquimarina TaxID=444919 RepID=UPI000417CB70|nr:oligogalacturonate-specific porin KdgM family protein [Psychromonas aquimarina]